MKHVGSQSNAKDIATQDQLGGGGGGISHAISDGTPYASKDGAWFRIPLVYKGTTFPISAANRINGDTWLTDEGQQLTWFIDADTAQWVDFNGSSAFVSKTSGDIEITDPAKGYILPSPNGTRWRITVNDSGVLQVTTV